MNNYKSVRKRLFTNNEVELKSEKIELGLITDFQKLANKFVNKGSVMEDTAKKGSDITDKIDKIKKELQPLIDSESKLQKEYNLLTKDIIGEYSLIDSEYSKIQKAAKELGIKYPKNIDESYKLATRYLKRAKR